MKINDIKEGYLKEINILSERLKTGEKNIEKL